jgi:hypothetical protein
VAQADGQQLEPAVRKAINDFVVGCKRDNIWNAIKASCILAGARTLAGALVPLKGTAPTNNGPFVSGDYNRETGLVGNGTSKYLDSNRNNNADPQDSNHNAVYLTERAGLNSAYINHGVSGNGANTIFVSSNEVDLLFRSRNASSSTLSSGANSLDLIAVNRAASTGYSYRAGGSTTAVTQASQTPSAGNVTLYVRSDLTSYSDGRMAFYSIGESLDLALLDARVSALITAIGAAIP